MIKNSLATLFIALFLTGCAGGGIGLNESPMWHLTASPESKIEYFRKLCLGFGEKPNTPELNQCIKTESRSSDRHARFSWY
ncbi:MAG: hypothetical protein NZ735_07275 [Candidatus Marinimicrobia bacterium]|nr:hypothetical protein [Candidatus Neomarinimicrobiota bacterium]